MTGILISACKNEKEEQLLQENHGEGKDVGEEQDVEEEQEKKINNEIPSSDGNENPFRIDSAIHGLKCVRQVIKITGDSPAKARIICLEHLNKALYRPEADLKLQVACLTFAKSVERIFFLIGICALLGALLSQATDLGDDFHPFSRDMIKVDETVDKDSTSYLKLHLQFLITSIAGCLLLASAFSFVIAFCVRYFIDIAGYILELQQMMYLVFVLVAFAALNIVIMHTTPEVSANVLANAYFIVVPILVMAMLPMNEIYKRRLGFGNVGTPATLWPLEVGMVLASLLGVITVLNSPLCRGLPVCHGPQCPTVMVPALAFYPLLTATAFSFFKSLFVYSKSPGNPLVLSAYVASLLITGAAVSCTLYTLHRVRLALDVSYYAAVFVWAGLVLLAGCIELTFAFRSCGVERWACLAVPKDCIKEVGCTCVRWSTTLHNTLFGKNEDEISRSSLQCFYAGQLAVALPFSWVYRLTGGSLSDFTCPDLQVLFCGTWVVLTAAFNTFASPSTPPTANKFTIMHKAFLSLFAGYGLFVLVLRCAPEARFSVFGYGHLIVFLLELCHDVLLFLSWIGRPWKRGFHVEVVEVLEPRRQPEVA